MQLDHDEVIGPLHGLYGTLDADFDVQRTIKRAKPTFFSCIFRKIVGLTTAHVDNKGMFDGQ